jgi:hypothetical protein
MVVVESTSDETVLVAEVLALVIEEDIASMEMSMLFDE